jgi:hypothetical protein
VLAGIRKEIFFNGSNLVLRYLLSRVSAGFGSGVDFMKPFWRTKIKMTKFMFMNFGFHGIFVI